MMARNIEIISKNPKDFVEVALAIEVLAYHNMNYLDTLIANNKAVSEEIQYLLSQALKLMS